MTPGNPQLVWRLKTSVFWVDYCFVQISMSDDLDLRFQHFPDSNQNALQICHRMSPVTFSKALLAQSSIHPRDGALGTCKPRQVRKMHRSSRSQCLWNLIAISAISWHFMCRLQSTHRVSILLMWCKAGTVAGNSPLRLLADGCKGRNRGNHFKSCFHDLQTHEIH